MVIYVPLKACRAMKPRASTNEDSTRKPFRDVIPVGGALVGLDVVVTVGTLRRNSNIDGYLSLCFGGT
jgi:hypothetical protein